METWRFDRVVIELARVLPRRTLVGALSVAALALPGVSQARKKRKKRKNKKKVTFNDFGCVDVGKFCKNAGQCCSGICQGKKGKRRCQAHDVGDCLADQDFCAGNEVACASGGICFRTTGNASFCGADDSGGTCAICAKDADSQTEFFQGAACVVCALCDDTGGTACFPPAVLD